MVALGVSRLIICTALFRIKPNVSAASINAFKTGCKAMVGQIPGTAITYALEAHKSIETLTLQIGLTKLEVGPPLESTAHRAKGFNISVMAIMEKPEDIKVYADHPVHRP